MSVKAIPDGYGTVTPYLVAKDADRLIDFLINVFDASVRYQSKDNDGKTTHSEVQIGNSIVMMGRARRDEEINHTMLYVYTEDTDKLYKKALDYGAKSLLEPVDQFYGDRNAGVIDTEGNSWWIATHIEDVSPEELDRRMKEQRG